MKLLIVESPSKIKSISKYLGKEYVIVATAGHILQLGTKSKIGIDDQYNPSYTKVASKSKFINKIKTEINKIGNHDNIILATDNDREGSGIAWAICHYFKLDINKTKRIIFNEITKDALLKAIQNPTIINMNIVRAQQSRQIIDKGVGYTISPLLTKYIKSGGLSAGRVQSPALSIIIDRENEITNKKNESKNESKNELEEIAKTYKIVGNFIFKHKINKIETQINLNGLLNHTYSTKKKVISFLEKCIHHAFTITNIHDSPKKISPPPPFITSTAQQTFGKKFGISGKQIMSILQKLYEKGLITYHRTDSCAISSNAITQIKEYVNNKYGGMYSKPRSWNNRNKKNSQEAHECIRVCNINKNVKLVGLERKIYNEILNRTVASQMADKLINVKTITISSPKDKYKFICNIETTIFKGFSIIYSINNDNENDINDLDNKYIFNKEDIGKIVQYSKIEGIELIEKTKTRYTETSLIKVLEDKSLGRPSTFASFSTKLLERGYIAKKDMVIPSANYIKITLLKKNADYEQKERKKKEKYIGEGQIIEKEVKTDEKREKGRLIPTELGYHVNKFLQTNFGNVLNYEFTSIIEGDLDLIANGEKKWRDVVKEYFEMFKPIATKLKSVKGVTKIYKTTNGGINGNKKKGNGERIIGKDSVTGENMYILEARYGPVLRYGDKGKKNKFIGLERGIDISNVEYKEALERSYPRKLGTSVDGIDVMFNNGKLGEYYQYDGKNYSIKKIYSEKNKHRIVSSNNQDKLNKFIEYISNKK